MATTPELPWLIAAAVSVVGGGGVWGWLAAHAQLKEAKRLALAAEPADLATAYASFAKTLNDQAEAFIAALQKERSDLVLQLSAVRHEVDRLSADHEQCLAENRQLKQRIDSLERRWLTKPDQVVVLAGGEATVVGAGEPDTPEKT